jgi:hypothetical protein
MGILPIGEPIDETLIPRSDTVDLTFSSSSSLKSSTFLFQTLRSSIKRIDSSASVFSCSSSSGEISSAKPVKVHIYHDPLPKRETARDEKSLGSNSWSTFDTSGGQAPDKVPLEYHV